MKQSKYLTVLSIYTFIGILTLNCTTLTLGASFGFGLMFGIISAGLTCILDILVKILNNGK